MLGTWNPTLVDLGLKDDVKPVCPQPYSVPKVHKSMFRKEVKILVKLGVIQEEHYSEWGVLSFFQPKSKTNQVISLSEFRNLNSQLTRKSYPMPKIRIMILKLEGFKYSASIG